jgi:hypothetical protein
MILALTVLLFVCALIRFLLDTQIRILRIALLLSHAEIGALGACIMSVGFVSFGMAMQSMLCKQVGFDRRKHAAPKRQFVLSWQWIAAHGFFPSGPASGRDKTPEFCRQKSCFRKSRQNWRVRSGNYDLTADLAHRQNATKLTCRLGCRLGWLGARPLSPRLLSNSQGLDRPARRRCFQHQQLKRANQAIARNLQRQFPAPPLRTNRERFVQLRMPIPN